VIVIKGLKNIKIKVGIIMGLIIAFRMFQMLGSGPDKFAAGYGFQPNPKLRTRLVVCHPAWTSSLSLSLFLEMWMRYFEV
jgi:hypothetical protein